MYSFYTYALLYLKYNISLSHKNIKTFKNNGSIATFINEIIISLSDLIKWSMEYWNISNVFEIL